MWDSERAQAVENLAESRHLLYSYIVVDVINSAGRYRSIPAFRERTWTCGSDAWLAETESANAHTVVVQVCKGLFLGGLEITVPVLVLQIPVSAAWHRRRTIWDVTLIGPPRPGLTHLRSHLSVLMLMC